MANVPENTLISQRIQQFDAKHNDDGIAINGWLIFSDGARREAHNPQGALVEPPADKQELDAIQLQYQEEILRRATENVQRRKQAVVQQTLPKSPAQKHQEFDAKHSKDGPGIQDGGFVYYPDGAYRDVNMMGVLCDAVPDRWNPGALERRIVKYWELRLRKAEDAFNHKREDWLRLAKVNSQNKFIQPPPENATKAANELRALKEEVLTLRAKLKKARKDENDAKPDYFWERQEASEKHSKENAMFIDSVTSVKI